VKYDRLYAHSKHGRPIEEGQPLEDHLANVGGLTAKFATAFGMAEAGRTLGLTHDLGKASADFQAYLRRGLRGGGPGHSDPGAAACAGILQELTPIVQGHHGGLPDDATSRSREEHANGEHTEAARKLALHLGVEESESFTTSLERRQLEPLLRMLLSCLVDADRLDTEAFSEGRCRLASYPKIAGYLAKLTQHLAGFQDSGNQVDRVRREVQADCRTASSLPPGFFRLTVPTGGGKTLASLLFALEHAVQHGKRRVVIAVPYTTVVEQTASAYAEIFGAANVLEHHAAYAEEDEPNESSDEGQSQVRRRWATENWDHPLIVTTNVQLLDSLLSRRTSKVRKLHRLARSVIVLDEAQTLPADLLQAHFDVLNWLVRHAGATVLLCTATQPDFSVIREAPEELKLAREIVEKPERHFAALNRVNFSLIGDRTHQDVAQELLGVDQGLVVVNSRADSVAIFRCLVGDPKALYLSTYLCPIHRQEKVSEMRKRLAPNVTCRVVSTQVVEAGIDISFPNVWRVKGPLEAIVQAAGRCNRNDEMRPQRGEVRIFDLIEGRTPKGDYETRTNVASKWLSGDLTELAFPNVQNAYFRRLLTPDSGSLSTDRHRDRKWLQKQREKLDYPFVEQHGRIIEEEETAVVVACWRPDKTDPLLEAARYEPRMVRRLAPYTLSLRQSAIKRYRGYIQPHESGILTYTGPYHEQLGIGGEGTLDPDPLIR
jgi:CRISPR-associated endonuclease/helicase Cas3